jgi:hypothetical protein
MELELSENLIEVLIGDIQKYSFHCFSFDDWYIAQKIPVNYITSRCIRQRTSVIMHL